jgi:osmotically-inducible protein OsmY
VAGLVQEEKMRTKQTTRTAGSSRALLLAVMGLALAGAVHASAATIAPADDQLRRAGEEAVRTSPYLGVFDYVIVDVDGGRAWLRGYVEWRQRGERTAAQVAALPGVVEVVNEIQVQSWAPDDVRLRRRLFERLYYGGGIPSDQQPRWPVRIVVNEGRVILAGELPRGAELARLRAMAWEAGALFVEVHLHDDTAPQRQAAACN